LNLDDLSGELARLGQVPPPGPGVLEAARETLWAAVAAEMLATGDEAGSRRAAKDEEDRPGRRRAGDRDA
jgi:hypothetical protein